MECYSVRVNFLFTILLTLFVLQDQFTALLYASSGSHLPVVKVLMDNGADVRTHDAVSLSS